MLYLVSHSTRKAGVDKQTETVVVNLLGIRRDRRPAVFSCSAVETLWRITRSRDCELFSLVAVSRIDQYPVQRQPFSAFMLLQDSFSHHRWYLRMLSQLSFHNVFSESCYFKLDCFPLLMYRSSAKSVLFAASFVLWIQTRQQLWCFMKESSIYPPFQIPSNPYRDQIC